MTDADLRAVISKQAIVAWQSGDWFGLYRELDLRPWLPHPADAHLMPPARDASEAAEQAHCDQLRRVLTELAGGGFRCKNPPAWAD